MKLKRKQNIANVVFFARGRAYRIRVLQFIARHCSSEFEGWQANATPQRRVGQAAYTVRRQPFHNTRRCRTHVAPSDSSQPLAAGGIRVIVEVQGQEVNRRRDEIDQRGARQLRGDST